MKKITIKRWLEVLIYIVITISLFVMGSECNDIKIFIISHLIALVVFIICVIIIALYGKKFK